MPIFLPGSQTETERERGGGYNSANSPSSEPQTAGLDIGLQQEEGGELQPFSHSEGVRRAV